MTKIFGLLAFALLSGSLNASDQTPDLFLEYQEDPLGSIIPVSISELALGMGEEMVSSSPSESAASLKREKISQGGDVFMPLSETDNDDLFYMGKLPDKETQSEVLGLSIDGGGIRGVIPALLLEKLETLLGDFEGKMAVTKVFDVLGGTSAGGLLSLGLAHGKSPSELVSVFKKEGATIFPKSGYFFIPNKINRAVNSCKNLIFRRYDNDNLKSFLMNDNFFGSSRLGELDKDVFVTSCGTDGHPHILKSKPFPTKDSSDPSSSAKNTDLDYVKSQKIPVWQAALATSAAPTFFPSVRVPLEGFGDKDLVDGGIWCNNPSFLVAAHLVKKFDVPFKNVHVLSLGTGKSPVDWLSRSAGQVTMAGPIIDALMRSNSTGNHMVMSSLLGNNYTRVNPTLDQPIDLDNISKGAMKKLSEAARKAEKDIEAFFNSNEKLLKKKLGD